MWLCSIYCYNWNDWISQLNLCLCILRWRQCKARILDASMCNLNLWLMDEPDEMIWQLLHESEGDLPIWKRRLARACWRYMKVNIMFTSIDLTLLNELHWLTNKYTFSYINMSSLQWGYVVPEITWTFALLLGVDSHSHQQPLQFKGSMTREKDAPHTPTLQ
jgi:hypothetical protein